MRLPTLLLVDDDREFVKAQMAALSTDFHILAAEGVNTGLQILQKKEVDCIVVDYYLNDGNGHDIASWVASNMPWCPVLLISARLDKKIAVDSFTHRVFDILEKPYGLDTVMGKLQAAITESRRNKDSKSRHTSTEAWSLDRERRVFRCAGEAISLTSTEVKILDILTLAINQVVSRDQLVQAIWGTMSVADNTLDTHLTNLRKKAPFFKTMIKGVRGVGYVFEP
ncbi:response regulator transcription factor [Bdellovibrio sp. HCB337]|uniref:response regulator transcription factor n=1 Tax=Bdellovibrio sp. HCB337 TaxID=3394358 RepID=UPI0039A4C36C